MGPDNNSNENNQTQAPDNVPAEAPGNIPSNFSPPVSNPGVKTSKFGFLKGGKAKLASIIIAAAIIIGGGAAAAYYAVVVPNNPQNVLKASVKNLLQKDQLSGKGHASFSTTEKGSFNGTTTMDYSLQTDKTKNASSGKFDISYSGVKIPLEARSVDNAFYLKFGDLTTLTSVISGFESLGVDDSSSVIKQLSSKISDKWIEFDQSLIGTATQNNCSVLTDQKSLSVEQVNQLLDIYDKNTFAIVNGTSSDTVDGKSVTKYELGLDKAKADEFGKELKQIDYIKKLEQCGDSSSAASKTEDFKGTSSLNVWIDKSKKELVKLQLSTKDDKTSTDVDFTFNNDPVNITKPDNAVPALQIYSDIISLFSGSINSSASQLPGSTGTTIY